MLTKIRWVWQRSTELELSLILNSMMVDFNTLTSIWLFSQSPQSSLTPIWLSSQNSHCSVISILLFSQSSHGSLTYLIHLFLCKDNAEVEIDSNDKNKWSTHLNKANESIQINELLAMLYWEFTMIKAYLSWLHSDASSGVAWSKR